MDEWMADDAYTGTRNFFLEQLDSTGDAAAAVQVQQSPPSSFDLLRVCSLCVFLSVVSLLRKYLLYISKFFSTEAALHVNPVALRRY